MSLTIQDESIMQKVTVIGHVTKMSVVLAFNLKERQTFLLKMSDLQFTVSL